ncbi:CsbD family protein [Methylobacterium terrae]|uniref:CsbD family protein n=1 Tax=Methylobacterium terrae TaxID=2202827 RepID=A0A2U8WIT4_9HYPH|nr:CsbD family protein [Methylobacterium terrae]AWN45172.1 CsbD family protein [Methylobacterium terrae]
MTKRAPSTSTEHVKGSVKEAIGKLTGDVRIESEGRRQKDEARSPKGTGPRRD